MKEGDEPGFEPTIPSPEPGSEPTVPSPEPGSAPTVPSPHPDAVAGDASPAGEPGLTREHPGRYVIERQLGRGGQSRVYLAIDTHLGRQIAFKQPLARTQSTGSQAALGRFFREARITAQLEHPNIVPIYEIGQRADGSYYCAQKLIRPKGEAGAPRTLQRALQSARSLKERLALLPHFIDVCNAMAFAHDRGVIHRDLKPENIVIGRFGDTVVLDWGLAKAKDSDENEDAEKKSTPDLGVSGSAGQTVFGYAFGTPRYMSPEQAEGRLDLIDERSDVWSLGIILYEILTGQSPFAQVPGKELVATVKRGTISPVRSVLPEVPPALAAVAEKALARDLDARYQSAGDLAEDVAAYQMGARVEVYDYSLWEIGRLFVRRHRAASVVGGIALVLLAIAGGIAATNYRRAQTNARLAERNLAKARENLASAYMEKAVSAAARYQWDRAAVYRAAARVQHDSPEARWGAMLAASRIGTEITHLSYPARSIISNVAFSPDGMRIAASGEAPAIRIWDRSTGGPPVTIGAAASMAYDLVWLPGSSQIATAHADGKARLWDVASGEQVRVLLETGDEVFTIDVSPDGDRIAAGTADGLVLVCDAGGDTACARLSGHKAYISEVEFSPDGSLLVSAGYDGQVRLWDTDTGKLERAFDAQSDRILDVAFSPDGTMVATAAHTPVVKLWRVADGSLLGRLSGHKRKVYSVAFSPDGAHLASCSTDGTVRLWDVATRQPIISQSLGVAFPVSRVAFSPDGRALAWPGADSIWIKGLSFVDKSFRSQSPIESLALSPDGKYLAHHLNREVVIRDAKTLAEVARLFGGMTREDLVFSPDGQVLAGQCYREGAERVCLWQVGTWHLLGILGQEGIGIDALAFSPDGRLVAGGTRGGPVVVWNRVTGDIAHQLVGHTDRVYALAFSPDGKTLVSGSFDMSVRLWDLAKETERARLTGHSHGIRDLAVSPDGNLVASASWDNSIGLWDLRSGREVGRLEGHEAYVFAVDFFDGNLLASGSWDGTIRIWDVARQALLTTFVSNAPRVHSLAISPDGKELFYGGRAVFRLSIQSPPPAATQLQRFLRATGLRFDGIELVRDQ